MSPEMQSQNVSVKIEQKYLNILNNISEQADISRHKLIHDILQLTIERLEFGRSIGFFQMIILIRNLARKINLLSAVEKVGQEEKAIPIRLSKDYLNRLDELSKQTDRTRHYLMKRFIEVGADELDKLYNKKVPVANNLMMRHLKKRLDSLCQEGEQAYNLYSSEIE